MSEKHFVAGFAAGLSEEMQKEGISRGRVLRAILSRMEGATTKGFLGTFQRRGISKARGKLSKLPGAGKALTRGERSNVMPAVSKIQKYFPKGERFNPFEYGRRTYSVASPILAKGRATQQARAARMASQAKTLRTPLAKPKPFKSMFSQRITGRAGPLPPSLKRFRERMARHSGS